MTEMTDLERAVLTKFLDGDHPILKSLRHQLKTCRVETRELTGVGFYTNLVVEESVSERIDGNLIIDDVVAQQIDGLRHGASFVLYIKNGALTMLEGSSYDESWPKKISSFKLSYRNSKGEGGMSDERDWQALAKILDQKKRNNPVEQSATDSE